MNQGPTHSSLRCTENRLAESLKQSVMNIWKNNDGDMTLRPQLTPRAPARPLPHPDSIPGGQALGLALCPPLSRQTAWLPAQGPVHLLLLCFGRASLSAGPGYFLDIICFKFPKQLYALGCWCPHLPDEKSHAGSPRREQNPGLLDTKAHALNHHNLPPLLNKQQWAL